MVSSCRTLPRMTGDGSSNSNHHHIDSTQTTKKEAPPSWSVASRTAAACLATAAILSSSLPAGAGVVGGHLDTGLHGQQGAPASAVMLLADDGDSTSSDGRADVSELVLELKRADRADLVLNSMVKINDVVDADEDGVLENPFAAEVRCRSNWCPYMLHR